MIKYALRCAKGHTFESWFANSEGYDAQAARGLVTCPACGSAKVEKAIMAPTLGAGTRKRSSRAKPPAPAAAEAGVAAPMAMPAPMEAELRSKLKELREHLTQHSENVGRRFKEEARKIHYGESEARSIYGEATLEDAKALHEEGIDIHPLPILPEDHN